AWLHRQLEHYRIPQSLIGRPSPLGPLQRRLPPVFQDREELAASANLAGSVREALAQAQALIVICSRNGARSRWVNEEIREFIALGRADRIQCLIVPECDDPSGLALPSTEVLPPALLEAGDEPLAADARNAGDGRRAAFLKLVAGIIGVRYDELRQRENARRQRRLAIFASAASLGFLMMTGLTLFAFISRAEAVRQRDIARQQTLAALRTTDFVKSLFQVSDPSEAKGRSITAREVLDRGAREIEGQLDNEPDVKAELISTLSEVYMGLGSFRSADALIRHSLSLKVSRKETRARQIGVLASSQALQANYVEAVANFSRAIALLDRPAELEDPSLYSRLLVGKAESLAALDRYDEAMRLAGSALTWDEQREGNGSADAARDLEAAGLTAQFAGDLKESRNDYAKALAIRLRINGELHPEVAHDLNNLGTAAYLQGDLSAAEHYWNEALATDERILGPNHPDLGIMLNNLGRVLVEQRKFARAIPLLERSVNLHLSQQSDTHDDLAFAFSNLALAKKGIGNTAAAENLFGRALEAAVVHHNRLTAPIMVDLADLHCERGDYSGAFDQLSQAAPIMKKQYPDDAWRSAWIDNTRGACLLRERQASGISLVTASAPIVLKRWNPNTMYGFEVVQRLRAAARSHR
ncbi:MAG TPA: toll/interleukin-1 receptor domain-containing protein, partial [Sphingomicrobium sp.]|nr:toll/interleukin-1 receptor domain-containing protein [Sphingomicrobium sp.]